RRHPASALISMFDAAAALLNHLLRGASWARERLQAHAGKTARFLLPPFVFSLSITDSGETKTAGNDAAIAAQFTLTLPLLPRLLMHDEAAYKEITIEGDTDFAGAIAYVARNLRWDAAEDLSRYTGDIAAERMVRAAQGLRLWGQQSFDSLARAFSEYWTEEQPLIAKTIHVRQFVADVDALRDDVERLEKRLQKIGG
ncbi:MAG: ubiquinone biosynthesis accessory factor UbiJ, partial [Burkholderiales bacterium]